MKRIILLSTLFYFLVSFDSMAQLKVLSNGSTQGGSTNGALRIETLFNWVDIGSDHELCDHVHFRSNVDHGYYFDKEIEVVGGQFSSFTGPLKLATQRNVKVYVLTNGKVGIGDATPSYKLDVNGDIATYGVLRISSDQRLKKDIKDITTDRVSNLYNLNAKTYFKDNSPLLSYRKTISETSDNDTAKTPQPTEEIDSTEKIGFIAQELKDYFPELVSMDDKGFYNIDYVSLIPVLVEALKEQNNRISEMEKKMHIKEKSAEVEELSYNSARIFQNLPNPFRENTVIEFYLPQEVSKANLYIYDLQGRQIKNIDVIQREHGNVTIFGSEFQPGMYKYSLIADGQLIGTESMVLTD